MNQEQLAFEAHPADVGMPAAVQAGAAIFNAEEVAERERQRRRSLEARSLDCGCVYYVHSDTGAMKERCPEYRRLEEILCERVEAWIPSGKAEAPENIGAAQAADKALSRHLKPEPKVWELSASMYQARAGVHAPHIGEISPTQYNRLSGRSRRAYDAKRSQEWQASADCKGQWRRLVVEAHERGEFHYSDSGVHREAKSAVLGAQIERNKQVAAERFVQARKDNQITGPDDVEIGQRVHSLMVGYGVVIKKNRKSCRLQCNFAWGESEVKCSYRELEYLHYNELKAKVEAELEK